MYPTTASSTRISWREKMLESQQIDFLTEIGADSSYSFDLDDFCSGAAKQESEKIREEPGSGYTRKEDAKDGYQDKRG